MNSTHKASYAGPHQFSVGVEHGIVNGTPIIRDDKPRTDLNGKLPGRALKFKQA